MSVCRLCGTADVSPLYRVRGCQIDRCLACGFVQVRDRPSIEELNQIYSGSYFQKAKYQDAFAQRKEGERRLEMLHRLGLGQTSRVLDAGCATGDFVALAQDRFEMSGIDISAEATALARQAVPAAASRIYTGLIEEQSFPRDRFDAIVLWDVVEHLWDPVETLRRLVEYLRPGGHLVLSTPNIGAVTAKLMGSRWAFMTPPEHLGFFSEVTMDHLLGRALGLEPVRAFSAGKWVNVGFLAYKLRRVFPAIPEGLVGLVQKSPLGSGSVYVPTADIQYAAAKKLAVERTA